MTDRRTEQADQNAAIKDPDEWVTGDEPPTAAQESYLSTLAREAHADLPERPDQGRGVQAHRRTPGRDGPRPVTLRDLALSVAAKGCDKAQFDDSKCKIAGRGGARGGPAGGRHLGEAASGDWWPGTWRAVWRRRSVGEPGLSSRRPPGGGGVPGDVRVPEDQHVDVGEAGRAPLSRPVFAAGLVHHGDPQAVELDPGDLRQPGAQRRAVVVAVHPDQPARPRGSIASSSASSTQSPACTTTSAASTAAQSGSGRSRARFGTWVSAVITRRIPPFSLAPSPRHRLFLASRASPVPGGRARRDRPPRRAPFRGGAQVARPGSSPASGDSSAAPSAAYGSTNRYRPVDRGRASGSSGR